MTELASTTATDKEERIDGRTMRRNRNRAAVITALLTMIREGDLHPAAADIAERAGVSHRSIFRYFDDLDDLVRTTIDQAFADARSLATVPELGVGSLADRVDSMVHSRIRLFESVDGPMQVARMRAATIPSIDDEISLIADQFRVQIAAHFAIELAELAEDERAHIVDAVLVLTSYEAYAIHLRMIHHDVDRMRAGWNAALLALLGS